MQQSRQIGSRMQCYNLCMGLAAKTICECLVLSVSLSRRLSLQQGRYKKEITNTLLPAPRPSLQQHWSSLPRLLPRRRASLPQHRSTRVAELCWLCRRLSGQEFSVMVTGIRSHTIFALGGDLQNLGDHHLKFLLYQAIKPLQCVLDIGPPQ